MQIFASSSCPVQAAKNLDDKRVIKMVLESAQILSTAVNERGGSAPYRSTHKNHPCVIWTGQTRQNYLWLFYHFVALCQEYTERYGKLHRSAQLQQALLDGSVFIPNGPLTEWPNCARSKQLGVDYTEMDNIHEAYRAYLNKRWELDKREPTWRGKP